MEVAESILHKHMLEFNFVDLLTIEEVQSTMAFLLEEKLPDTIKQSLLKMYDELQFWLRD